MRNGELNELAPKTGTPCFWSGDVMKKKRPTRITITKLRSSFVYASRDASFCIIGCMFLPMKHSWPTERLTWINMTAIPGTRAAAMSHDLRAMTGSFGQPRVVNGIRGET